MVENTYICNLCHKRRKSNGDDSCPKSLIPEWVYDDGTTERIPTNDKILNIDCRHFSCSNHGIPAAIEALKTGNFDYYYVGINKTPVLAIPFGSDEKPTHLGHLRIVNRSGAIFSLQNGIYYPTGQSI